MRIHDSLLEVNTRLQDNPQTTKSNKFKDTLSPSKVISFAEQLNNSLQANTVAVQQNLGSQNVATYWLQYYMPKPIQKIKANSYLPLSEM